MKTPFAILLLALALFNKCAGEPKTVLEKPVETVEIPEPDTVAGKCKVTDVNWYRRPRTYWVEEPSK